MQQREGDRVRVRQAAPELAPEVVERHGQVRRGARDVDVDAPTSAEVSTALLIANVLVISIVHLPSDQTNTPLAMVNVRLHVHGTRPPRIRSSRGRSPPMDTSARRQSPSGPLATSGRAWGTCWISRGSSLLPSASNLAR